MSDKTHDNREDGPVRGHQDGSTTTTQQDPSCQVCPGKARRRGRGTLHVGIPGRTPHRAHHTRPTRSQLNINDARTIGEILIQTADEMTTHHNNQTEGEENDGSPEKHPAEG